MARYFLENKQKLTYGGSMLSLDFKTFVVNVNEESIVCEIFYEKLKFYVIYCIIAQNNVIMTTDTILPCHHDNTFFHHVNAKMASQVRHHIYIKLSCHHSSLITITISCHYDHYENDIMVSSCYQNIITMLPSG
jgi:hypothetical protein